MGVPAHFSKRRTQEYERKITSAKIRAQNHEHKNASAKSGKSVGKYERKITKTKNHQKYERKITSANLEILYSGNFLETTHWKFLGNYMLGNFWKLYAGNLFMETMS